MAVMLSTSYQLILSVKSSTYSQFRLYGKINSEDITNNKHNISLQTRLYGNDGSGSFDSGTTKINGSSSSLGKTSYSNGKETTLKTLTYDVKHASNGEYINKAVTAEITSTASVKASLTGYISLPTIPRKANVTSSSDFTDEQNPVVYFNNPGGFSVHPYLNFYDNSGSLVYSLERNVSASSPYSWNISDTERTAFRKATNKQMKYKVQVGVETFNGSSNLGANSVTQYMTYVNVDPEASATFEETNQKVIDLLGSSNCDTLIQNVSKVKFSVVPTAKKESTIKSVQLIHDNIAIGKDKSPYEYIFDVKNSIFQVRVADSRTNAKDFTYTKNIIEYSPVDITSFSFKRQTQTSSEIILNATLRYTQTNFGSIANVPTISWKMGESGELKTLSSSDYTIDIEKKEITIKNLSLGEILDYRKKEKFFLYVNDLLTEDKENEDVIKGLTTIDIGEHDLNVNGTITLCDTEGNNKIDIRDYLFEYEVIGTMLKKSMLNFKTIMIDLASIFYKDDKLENHLFYKDGDRYNHNSDDKSTQIYCGGCLTSSKKAVVWSVMFPKRLDKIKTIQINSMRVSARHADGGYIITNGDPRDYGTIDYDIISENTITFTLTLKTAASFTNNTPVNVRFEADLTFKE